MGVAELRDAFNNVAMPAGFTCTQALMNIAHAQDTEWHIITFSGQGPNGAFAINSDRIPPGGDFAETVSVTAKRLIAP